MMKKQIISALVSASMVASMVPVTAIAAPIASSAQPLTVPETQSKAPVFSKAEDTLVSPSDNIAMFVASGYAAGTVFKIYSSSTGGEAVAGATVGYDTGNIQVTFTTIPKTDTTYYISATETGKTESQRVAVTVKAYVLSKDATLSKIQYSISGVSGTFEVSGLNKDTLEYNVTLPEGTDIGQTINIYAQASHSSSAILAGSATTSYEGSTASILVTSEDKTVKKEYKVTFTVPKVEESTQPVFDKAADSLTTASDKSAEFTLSTAYASGTEFKIYDSSSATSVSSGATVVVEGTKVTVTLNSVPTANKTYYISAKETGKEESQKTAVTVNAYEAGTNANLSALKYKVNGGAEVAVPNFSDDTTQYSITLPSDTVMGREIVLVGTLSDSKATITEQTTASTALTDSVAKIKITAEDGKTVKEYRVTFKVAAPAVVETTQPAFDKAVDSLTAASDKSAEFTLSTAYASGTEFKIYDSSSATSVSSGATVVVEGTKVTVTLNSVPTANKTYYISAKETGKDESQKTAVTVNAYETGTNAKLSTLKYKVNGGSEIAVPNFSADTTEYSITLPSDTVMGREIALVGTLSDSKATITEQTTASTALTDSVAKIKVTAEDGKTVKEYKVTFKVAAPSVVESTKPAFSKAVDSLTTKTDKVAEFTLSTTYASGTTLKIYDGETDKSVSANATVALSGTKVTVTLNSVPTANKTFYITATQSGKSESQKTAVTVKAFGETVNSSIVYVGGTKGSDSNNGTSTSTPFATLSSALKAVKDGGKIVVCGDVSKESGQITLDKKVTITNSYGSYTNKSAVINVNSILVKADTTFENVTLKGTASSSAITGASEGVSITFDNVKFANTLEVSNSSNYAVNVSVKNSGSKSSGAVSANVVDKSATKSKLNVTIDNSYLSGGGTSSGYIGNVTLKNGGMLFTKQQINNLTSTGTSSNSLVLERGMQYYINGTISVGTKKINVVYEDSRIPSNGTVLISGDKTNKSIDIDKFNLTNKKFALIQNRDYELVSAIATDAPRFSNDVDTLDSSSDRRVEFKLKNTPERGTKFRIYNNEDKDKEMGTVDYDGRTLEVKLDRTISKTTYFYITATEKDKAESSTAEVRVKRYSSSSDSDKDSTYSITDTTSSRENGTIKLSRTSASEGTKVTITPKPDRGYELDRIVVTDKDGDRVKLTDNDDGTYTFKMPDRRVSVKAEFTKIDNDKPSKPDDSKPSTTIFSDVPSNAWYAEAVKYVVNNGIMSGMGNNKFSPDTKTTRGMIVTMLYNASGAPSTNKLAGFKDVASNAYYAKPIDWAVENGIVSGMGNGNFAPNDNITREQLALMLYKYAQYQGRSVSGSANLGVFVDSSSVSNWSRTAVSWAVNEGIISGRGYGMLAPKDFASRAETASMIMRFLNNNR